MLNIKHLWERLVSPSPPIPDTIAELLNTIPPKALGGVCIYELSNHDLEYRTCGNIKLDTVTRNLFKFAYEWARFGIEPPERNNNELEEEEGS